MSQYWLDGDGLIFFFSVSYLELQRDLRVYDTSSWTAIDLMVWFMTLAEIWFQHVCYCFAQKAADTDISITVAVDRLYR